jgi:trehalose 6-phosphate synthase
MSHRCSQGCPYVTYERLGPTVSRVGAADVVIASNRGPVGFRRSPDGTIESSRGGGGLVSGMAGLATDGAALWVCAALSDTDREVAGHAPGGRVDLAGYDVDGAVEMLAIDPATLAGAYTTIANTTLWYLHHGLSDATEPLRFDAAWRRDWAAYIAYNETFAVAIAAAVREAGRVLVQDYHLSLLPAMLRARRPDLRIGHFTHTPWADPATFGSLLTDVAHDLLIGMLGSDSVGFHSPRWARNFVDCCVAILGAEDHGDTVRYDDHVTAVRVHPLGVDAGPLLARAAEPDVAARRADLASKIGERQAIVRVDRTEPAKNIVRGIAAFRELLERFPEHREQVVHVALAYPSRQDVADYRRYAEEIETVAGELNAAFATPTWTPLILTIRDDYPLSLATLQLGDVQLINPVRDGMNLVAKEAALLSRDAVLVLSREAGAADQMGEFALLVDPFDVSATATALHTALTMPAAERGRRHVGLVRAATALPPQEWLRQQLDALDG